MPLRPLIGITLATPKPGKTREGCTPEKMASLLSYCNRASYIAIFFRLFDSSAKN